MAERFIDTPFEPCLKYQVDFDPEEGDKHVVLVEYTKDKNPMDKEKSVSKILQYREYIRKFTGTGGEELIYTYDNYNTLAEDMQMVTIKKWSEFPKILMNGPRKQ